MSSTTVSFTWPPGTTTASTPPLTGLCPTGATSQVGQGQQKSASCLREPQTDVLSFYVSEDPGCSSGVLKLRVDCFILAGSVQWGGVWNDMRVTLGSGRLVLLLGGE